MGMWKEGGKELQYEEDNAQKIVKSCTAYIFWLLVSMIGGVVLGWWEYRHHPTNTQLWMVPFGLILFLTPLIVCFILFLSELLIRFHWYMLKEYIGDTVTGIPMARMDSPYSEQTSVMPRRLNMLETLGPEVQEYCLNPPLQTVGRTTVTSFAQKPSSENINSNPRK